MVVDALTYLGPCLFGGGSTAEGLLETLGAAGIDQAVVCPARPPGYRLGPANEAVAALAAQEPGRVAGFGRVDPNEHDAAEQAEHALGALGLRGLLLHPWEETFRVSAPLVDPVLEVARQQGAPVIVAAGYPFVSEGLQVGELALRFPDVCLIATNGGQINISGLGQTDVELAMERAPNLHLQTAGVYREDFLEGVVERFGAERLLFSSGYPVFEPRLEVERPRSMHVADDLKGLILGGNAARILAGGSLDV